MNYNFAENLQVTNSTRLLIMVILVAFVINMGIPQTSQAQINLLVAPKESPLALNSATSNDILTARFIKFENLEVVRTYSVVATGYNSEVGQCDDTPCITANGFNVCEHNKEDVIAANFLKFNTKVRIPELFGDKVFTVQDRMNPRYNYRIDIWMKNRTDALSFGKRYVKIEIVEEAK